MSGGGVYQSMVDMFGDEQKFMAVTEALVQQQTQTANLERLTLEHARLKEENQQLTQDKKQLEQRFSENNEHQNREIEEHALHIEQLNESLKKQQEENKRLVL